MNVWKDACWTSAVVVTLALAATSSTAATKASGDGLCLGGPPQPVAGKVGAPGHRDGGGHWEQASFLVAEGKLLWTSHRQLIQIDLATLAPSARRLTRPMILVAAKNGEALGIEDSHGQTFGGDLFVVNLKTGEERTVLAGGVSQRFSLYQFDGADLYFIRGPYDQVSRVGEKHSRFFRLRAARGEPEFLGYEPQGNYTAFRVERGFVYWNREVAADRFELSRRTLKQDSPITKLAPTEKRHLSLALAQGRAYYLDNGSLYSIPQGGSKPPIQHVAATGPNAEHLLVQGNCAYWTTSAAIMRVRLDGKDAREPEIVADEDHYRGGPIATDGRFLYWADLVHNTFVRVGPDARAVAPRRALVAKPVELPGQPPDAPGDGSSVAVGDGWGCARVFGWSQAHWQCWGNDFVSSPAPHVRAQTVPWLSASELPVGPAKLCFLHQRSDRCWPWPDFAKARPSDLPEVQKREGRGSREAMDGQLLVGGTFACTIQYVGAERMLQCSGDNSFGQLALGEQPEMLEPEPWQGTVGTWHGCVKPRRGGEIHCWGRADGGQLGFAPTETCSVAGRRTPCNTSPHRLAFPLKGVHGLFGGDMFTCATLRTASPTRLVCWGASRDGWLGQAACPAELRTAWPAGAGSVAAPKATCSRTPVELPALAGVGPDISVGPRGICAVVDQHARCVGAIPAPSVQVTQVKVSPGMRASACGIAAGEVVCWGEGYSPAAAPAQVVPIEFAATKPFAAVVDFPPPDGAEWPKDRQIYRGCSEPTTPLPACAADAEGQPWSSLADRASEWNGKRIVVRDRLVVAPVSSRDSGWHSGASRRAVALGEGASPLRFWGDRPQFACTGDESRLCCRTQAFGQIVVATGELVGSKAGGWFLTSAEACEVEVEQPR